MKRVMSILAGLLLAAGCTVVASPGGPDRVAIALPRLVLIEGTGIQYAPDVSEDVFCYGGAWYRCGGGVWSRSAVYGGPWVVIQQPPPVFYRIPPGHVKYNVVRPRPAGGPHPVIVPDRPERGKPGPEPKGRPEPKDRPDSKDNPKGDSRH